VSIDLNHKKTAYRRNGVREYVVWRTEDAKIDWFSLQSGDFVPIPPEADGTIRSTIFPGLWLAPAMLLGGDLAAVCGLLDRATSTPEHVEFVKRISAA
jgi:Uma2 family endonuclease